MDEQLYDEFGNYIGPEIADDEDQAMDTDQGRSPIYDRSPEGRSPMESEQNFPVSEQDKLALSIREASGT